MAKPRGTKPNSRASRRALSPPPPTVPETSTRAVSPTVPEKVAVLGVRGDQGVSKKKKKGKQLSRAQKERKAAAMERAEAAMGKLEKKVEESKGRAKIVDGRRGAWEEQNEKVHKELEKAARMADIKA
ncbi:hypothetical protein EX30DRAFT_396253 [Ascodesmis nigricans]|uniref:Uncharacterized protein n=1 Tax=Ascodesmis nigricans TaxID=341454 RepID=A0A4S2MVG3_9PEZI|nr:hypothetical protein EX30DRAFT_396253 [Ascodesmis nigricans]